MPAAASELARLLELLFSRPFLCSLITNFTDGQLWRSVIQSAPPAAAGACRRDTACLYNLMEYSLELYT